ARFAPGYALLPDIASLRPGDGIIQTRLERIVIHGELATETGYAEFNPHHLVRFLSERRGAVRIPSCEQRAPHPFGVSGVDDEREPRAADLRGLCRHEPDP